VDPIPSIKKRVNKDGSVSYKIRVFVEEGPDGQDSRSKTWRAPVGMSEATADKRANKEAILFEESVKTGGVTKQGKMRFAEYAAHWMETSEFEIKTRVVYDHLLTRINRAFGHIQLEKLNAEQITAFMANLKEDGIRARDTFAVSINLGEHRAAANLSMKKLGELAGLSDLTVCRAEHGERILIETAEKLCAALGLEVSDVFTVEQGKGKLSAGTIAKYFALIRTILNSAKKKRILRENVTDFIDPPKNPRPNIKFLDDVAAAKYLAALIEYDDIRAKTALIIDLFTGVRNSELCGLSWHEIDFHASKIHVRFGSLYARGYGIYKKDTKTEKSERSIDITEFVVNVLKDYKAWWEDYRFNYGGEWKGEEARLFIQRDGKPICPTTINKWMNKFNEEHGFDHITPHGLRHTFASLSLANGTDIKTVQARTGHSLASTLLNVYGHAIESKQTVAAQSYEDTLLGVKGEKGEQIASS